jgi:Regulator of chromosome condensation (RCC1) repeat
VYAWGYGTLGRLGVGLMKFSKEPILVEGLLDKNVLQVVASVDHSMVLVEEFV